MKYFYNTDNKDLKIIGAIADNARLPYSKISKLTRISKDRVRERLNRLNFGNGAFILSYFPLINYAKLGYTTFHVFIRFKDISFDTIFYKKITFCKNLFAFTKLTGRYDYELQILTRNQKELQKILNELKINKTHFSNIIILPSSTLYLFSMQVYNKSFKKFFKLLEYRKEERIDSLDKNILKLLSINARKNLIDIADELNCSEGIIRYRIKSLIKKDIIKGFFARTNKHRFGLNSYILLMKLVKHNEKKLRNIGNKENVYYIKKCDGRWNLIINFYAKDNFQLNNTLSSIREILRDDLNQFDLFILLDRIKFNPFPEIILN